MSLSTRQALLNVSRISRTSIGSEISRRSLNHFANAPLTFWSRSPLPSPPGYESSRHRKPSVPAEQDGITTPAEFLRRIARGREEAFDGYAEKVTAEASSSASASAEGESGNPWSTFWTMRGRELDRLGVPVKYILRCMEGFRQGKDLSELVVPVKKPKQFRGRGDRIQKGFRVRVAKDFYRSYNGTQPLKVSKLPRKRRLTAAPSS